MCGAERGTYNSGVIIQTESFTIDEVIFILNVLKIKFNLDCSIHVPEARKKLSNFFAYAPKK